MEQGRRLWGGTAILAAVLLAAACGGAEHEVESDDDRGGGVSGPSTVAPAPTATPAATPTPAPGGAKATVAYNPDIKPILDASCLQCHGELGSYAGALTMVQPGNAASRLVRVTQPGGSMYSHLVADRATNAELIRSWVVDNGAAESR